MIWVKYPAGILEGYDKEKILEIQDNINDDELGSYDEFNNSAKGNENIVMSMNTNKTKSINTKIFYGKVSRKQLLKWEMEELLAKLDQDPFYSDNADLQSPLFTFEVKAVYVNDQRVYLEPLGTPNKVRPIFYAGMIQLPNTNYFFGMYTLARPITTVMTKVIRRSIDNEIISGSNVFAADPEVMDMGTMKFEPGAFWRTYPGALENSGKTMRDAIHQFQFPSVSGSLMSVFQIFDALLDEITMVPKNLTGISTAGEQTATEVSQNLSSAQTIILSILKRFDNAMMKPIIESFYHWIQIDENTPSYAIADAVIRVHGADTFANQVINKKMVMEFLNIAPNLQAIDQSTFNKIDSSALITTFLEGLGMEKDEFLRPEDEVNLITQLQQQMQQLTQQLEQMQEQAKEQQKENVKLKDTNDGLKLENSSLNDTVQREGKRIKSERDLEVEKAKNKKLSSLVERATSKETT